MSRLTQQQSYIRVTQRRADGFVEFDFSYGDPDLYVELILPAPAFHEFCANNSTRFLSNSNAAALDADRRKWREGGLD